MAISKSFYRDWSSAKQNIRNDAKSVMVVRLTKSGQHNKMADATKYFNSIEEANNWIDNVRKLNPTSVMNFDIIVR